MLFLPATSATRASEYLFARREQPNEVFFAKDFGWLVLPVMPPRHLQLHRPISIDEWSWGVVSCSMILLRSLHNYVSLFLESLIQK